jgi:TATA-binding protein-associated factor Taf7
MYKLDQEGIANFNHLYVKQNPTMFLKEEQQDEDSDEEEKDSDDSSNYEGSDDEEEEWVVEEEQEEEYNGYNLKQQVRIITKQLANLTAIVYKSFVGKGKNVEMPFH